ncbi:hypothetical protein cypCar_00035745 [Cyprinus carpio]|nr:hypothetical protein cypCar_00035745 [Cyprinus carpio]
MTRGSCLPEGAQSAHLNGCVPLSHQVAGHKYGVDKVGICKSGWYGPEQLQLSKRTREMKFTLEDVTRRFQKPCIMDVKIGQKSYDPFASQEKREQQIRKYPLMEEIGFLVLGMRVYKVGSDSFDTYDQHYGRGLVKDAIKEDAITASILRVQKILQWFEAQSRFNFYASSLLFVYEGVYEGVSQTLRESPTAPEACEQNNNINQSLSNMYSLHKKSCGRSHHQANQDNGVWSSSQQPNGNRSLARLEEDRKESKSEAGQETVSDVEVKMIDFAHVFPSDVPDQGYIYGLKNLLKVLHQILEE